MTPIVSNWVDSTRMQKNDWHFTEQPVDINRYRGQGNDLSDSINQGQRLNDLRKLADITTEILAQQVGMTQDELLAIEAGLMVLRQAQAIKLAQALNVEFGKLWVKDGTGRKQ